MNPWFAPGSCLAPLVVGGDVETPHGLSFRRALVLAADTVPETVIAYTGRPTGRLRAVRSDRRRMLVCETGGTESPFTLTVRLVDVEPETPASSASWASTHWELGMRDLEPGSAQPAIRAGVPMAMLEVTGFRVTATGLAGGPQLALVRHLWVRTLQHTDPDLTVVGGQHDWSDDWWQEAASDTERIS